MSEVFNVELATGNTVKLDFYGKFGPSELGMIDARTVSASLARFPDAKSINVRINSQGGSAFEGLGIYNILKSHPATVHVRIDGVAASAASLVAMAGDTIEMPSNALMMIHDPQTIVQGDSASLSSAAEMLSKLKESCCQIYADKSNRSVESISLMMTAETWMTGTEAVQLGFASKTDKSLAVPKMATPAAFLSLFKCAPDNFAQLVSLSHEPTEKKEPIMADTIVTPLVAEPHPVNLDAVKLEAATAERKRAADIISLCEMACHPQMAGDFIANGAEVETVRQKLLEKVCLERKTTDSGKTALESPPPVTDENSPYKAEYAQMSAEYAKQGITEADYVTMRRIDDGKEFLQTKVA